MRSEEEIKSFIFAFFSFLKNKLPEDILKKVSNHALSVSPSKAFRDATSIAMLYGVKTIDPKVSIALSKFARWISVLARDYGKQNAEKFLHNQLFLSCYTNMQPQKISQKNSSTKIIIQKDRNHKISVNTGTYVFGDYEAVGRFRASEILSRVDFDIDPIFALDMFYTFYLINTAMKKDSTHREFFEELLKSDEVKQIRMSTVADEILSYAVTIKFLEEFKERIENMDKDSKARIINALENWDKADKESKEESIKLIIESIEDVKKEMKNLEKMKILIDSAGVGHLLSFDAKLDTVLSEYKNIDVEKILKLAKVFGDILESDEKIEGLDEYEGFVRIDDFWEDLMLIPAMELMDDDDTFYYKYATGEIVKYDVKAKKTLKSFTVLVDKSGSMSNNQKTEWSRAVTLALLMWAKEKGADISMFFFDDSPHKELIEFDEIWHWIMKVRCEGGTNIDKALTRVENRDVVVIITDGQDKVTFEKPDNMTLISVMINGNNITLKRISDAYLSVDPTIEGFIQITKKIKESVKDKT